MLRAGVRKLLLQRRRGSDSHRRALRRQEALQTLLPDGPLQAHGTTHQQLLPQSSQLASRASGAMQATPTATLTASHKTTDTHQQRILADAIRQTTTWEDALATFGRASDVAPSATTFQVLARTLVQHRAQQVTASPLLDDMLRDAAEGSDRWALSDADRYEMARYVLTQDLKRPQTADLFVDPRHKSVQEGPDNGVVTLLEASMRRHGIAPSMDVLADLMCLRISWTSALRLLRFGREAHNGMVPLGEMYERAAFLATAPGKTSFGSRPWTLGLALYQEQREAGLTVTIGAHTSALHAVWRSCDRSWLSPRGTISQQQASLVWSMALRVLHNVQYDETPVRGEDGCRLYEAAIQALAHASHWAAAVSLLTNLELSASDVSPSMRVPTATSIAAAMAGCIRSGNMSYADTLGQLFLSYGYSWRLLPPETLRMLLSVLRDAVRQGNPSLAQTVVDDVTSASTVITGSGQAALFVERRIALECLNVVSMMQLPMEANKRWATALRLVAAYDANVWPTQPLERKLELVALFRGIRRIAATCNRSTVNQLQHRVAPPPHAVETLTAAWLKRVFGTRSAEWEWWEDSLAHRAGTPMSWCASLALLEDLIGRRGAKHVPYLPFPLRQLHHLIVLSMWSSVDPKANRRGIGRRAVDGVDDDDDGEATAVDADAASLGQSIAEVKRTLATVEHMYANGNAVMPWYVVGCLRMRIAAMLHTGGPTTSQDGPDTVKQWSSAALAALGLGPRASMHTPSGVVADATLVLGMPTEQVEALFSDMHVALRRIALNIDAVGHNTLQGAVGAQQGGDEAPAVTLEAHCW